MNAYVTTIVTVIVIQAIAVCGLNVIVGYAGQISLGHAAFFGIGAYAAALLATKAGFSFWLGLPLVICISGLIGLLLGLPSIRVREDFLAITTIGINFIVEAVFRYVPFFGGALGLGGIPRILFFDIRMKGQAFLILAICFLVICMLVSWWLTKSWASLACYAIREDESAASTLGISPVRFKLFAFVVGTAMAGLSGSLYAHYMQFISAGDFSFPVSVGFLSMLVLGGMGTLWGPLIGTIILGILPEVFRPLVDYRVFLYTLLLLLMIRFQPGGLLGEGSVARRALAPLFFRGGKR